MSPDRRFARDGAIDVETHYNEAGMDYRAWSAGFNMHFGYFRPGMNPFSLEPMLEEMSAQVFDRLRLADGQRVLDLGCGAGAPARALARRRPVAVTAVTRVESQLRLARALSEGTLLRGSVEWTLGDYTALDFAPGSFDAAFSIEASCHAAGESKEAFVREAARLLCPGARLVVADGFMKKPLASLPRWYRALLGSMTRRWAVERFADLDAFHAALERHGFAVEAVEDASWRIAPSVLHVPRVTLKFLFRELVIRRQRLSRARWSHVGASVLSPLIGLGRPWFGYYLLTARRIQ